MSFHLQPWAEYGLCVNENLPFHLFSFEMMHKVVPVELIQPSGFSFPVLLLPRYPNLSELFVRRDLKVS